MQVDGTYSRPVVLIGALSRSAAQAVVRVDGLAMDIGGAWSFRLRGEQVALSLCSSCCPILPSL